MTALNGLTNEQIRNDFNGLNPIGDALSALRPGAQFTIRGLSYEDIEWMSKNIDDMPRKEVLEAKLDEIIQEKVRYNTYVPLREIEYPPMTSQLDMIYWDKVNGTNKWIEAIQAIKAMYPKPLP